MGYRGQWRTGDMGTWAIGHMGNRGTEGNAVQGYGSHGQLGPWAIGIFVTVPSSILHGSVQKFYWT